MTDASTQLERAAAEADAALGRLQQVLGALSDHDLHRAHRNGGWSVAGVVSHINLCSLLWIGDLRRLADDPELDVFFREEVGHDALGYPPPSSEIAVAQLERTRRTIGRSLPAAVAGVAARRVTIPDLGTMSIAEWTPLILGHLSGHVQQALDILTDRDALPAGVA